MFSAYDLKKIIPRAIFALVAVNLSWGLMELFIRAVQALGDGAQALIMAPFQEAGLTGVQLSTSGGLAFSTIIAGAAGAAIVGIVPVVGVAISALFGLLFAFGIIMLRKVILIGLIIIAPVAIALSVFPQTEDYAKKWWEWFSKLLLMYPFIMAMFGLSEVAAGIISRTKGTGDAAGLQEVIYQLGAIILLIIPYFLVGKALSLAGGAIGKVAGMVNNKDRGLIDKTKKWDQGRVTENRDKMKAGTRYGDRFGTRTINRAGGLVFNRGSNKRLQNSFQQRKAGLEEKHPGIKSWTGAEARLMAEAEGSQAKLDKAVDNYAGEMYRDDLKKQQEERAAGRSYTARSLSEFQSEAKAIADSGKLKAGGLNAAVSAAALEVAAAKGGITDGATLERLAAETAQTAVGKKGAHLGTQLGKEVTAAATAKANEKLATQLMTINQAEQAGLHEYADNVREQAGIKYTQIPGGGVKFTVAEKGTLADMRSAGTSHTGGPNKGDMEARTPATYTEAGLDRTRPDAPLGTSPAAPITTRTTSTTPPRPHTFSVGETVRSTKQGATGTVTGMAPDGNPLVQYNSDGSPIAYTKPENLEHH